MFTLFCLWKTYPLLTHTHPKNGREKTALPVENILFKDILRRSQPPWDGFIGELYIPGYILYPRPMKPKVQVKASGLSTWQSPCLSLG